MFSKFMDPDTKLTNELLLKFMPWHSGWYLDEEGNPTEHSVLLSSVLTMSHLHTLVPPKEYKQ